jgi:OOP family OmpA-OmpF porin
MPDTLLASLASALKPSTPEVARSLGEPEQAVSRGFELATAAVFEGLARKTKDPDMLRRVIDLASKTPANLKPTAVSAGQLTDPNSPLITDGKRLLSNLFGNREDALLASVSRESGLRAGTTPVVLAVAAQSVLSFLGTRVRDEGMTGTELAGFLRSSAAGLRSSLPPELRETFTTSPPGVHEPSPVIAQAIDTDPVVFQTERKERSLLPWLLVPLALILLGLLWYAFRPHRLPVAVAPVPSAPVAETPAPVAPAAPDLGNLVSRQLVDGTRLSIPANGVEGRLLAFIQDPSSTPDKTTWFDFDRLLFDTGSATLQPQSDEQLHNIAAILTAYPNVHLKIGGYTDNVGSAAANLQLSQDRATAVMRQLVNLGISPNRLSAQGYGEDHAVGDNSTDAGRALNRRVSMLVTQK